MKSLFDALSPLPDAKADRASVKNKKTAICLIFIDFSSNSDIVT
jgi:hypothetical protein